VEIRDAEPTDAAALQAVHLATWEQTYQVHSTEPWYDKGLAAHATRDWSEILRSQTARGGGVLVAGREGQIVAFCQYGPTEDDDHDPAHVGQIQRLYVHPDRQRAGVGGALLNAAIGRLRESRAGTATLWVLETDQRARAFYERLGWRSDGTRVMHPPMDVRYTLALQ
jgi:ribosomal protein S18 acetylase RimI-like enzyme